MVFDSEKYGPWVVVAGASEGTGTAFARQLAAAGLNLVLVARNAERLDELAEELRQEQGVEVRPVPLDLSRPDRLEVLRSETDDVEVGLMVYNAGSSYGSGPFLENALESSLQTIQLNPAGQVSTDTPARERSGVQDLPGQIVDRPEEVVRLCLANIANGPVVLPPHLEEGFQQLHAMPRRQAAEAMRNLLVSLKP